MPNYRRLISYIYAYEGGIKGKNTGYAKLEVRGDQCRVQVNVKKVFVGSNDIGVYLLAPGKEILVGKIFIRGGSGEFRANVSAANVESSGYGFDQCYGLTIHDLGSTWQSYTTIWEDAVAQAAQVQLEHVTAENVRRQEAQRKAGEIPENREPYPITAEIQRTLEQEEIRMQDVQPWQVEEPGPGAAPEAEAPAGTGDGMTEGVQGGGTGTTAGTASTGTGTTAGAASAGTADAGGAATTGAAGAGGAATAGAAGIPGTTPVTGAASAPETPTDSIQESGTGAQPESVEENPYIPVELEGPADNRPCQTGFGSGMPVIPPEMPATPAPGNPRIPPAMPSVPPQGAAVMPAIPATPAQGIPGIPPSIPTVPPQPSAAVPPVTPSVPSAPSVPPSMASHTREDLWAELEDEEVLRLLEQKEQEAKARMNPSSLWSRLQRNYSKVLAFDYDHGCEILSIKPQDIGILPREIWVYGNNSFLLHGYYNYRHLILARLENPKGRPRYLLGVPGHYYSNEKYMASMFGFPHFVLARKQPDQDGRFGYWYTDIRL